MNKTDRREAYERLCIIENEQTVEELLYLYSLFGVLEV